MNSERRHETAAPDDTARVTVSDLGRITQLQALLSTLNDPKAGADIIARHVAQIPVLRARVAQRFLRQHPSWTKHDVAQQIALLGNRELEAILFDLLEDIVTLHSQVEPDRRHNF